MSTLLEAKTNIVYFTSTCNLGCTYCFESLDTVKAKHLSRQELIEIADTVINGEPINEQTQFVLFGGEPTLKWDEVIFFMDYCYSKKKNVSFNMVTNGIKFLDDDFFVEVFSNIHYVHNRLWIDISFDGLEGSVDRVYKNGSESAMDLVRILSKIKINNLKYRLRYTIHKKNIHMFVPDIIKAVNSFDPTRVIIGVVSEQLDDTDNELLEKGYQKLKSMWINNTLEVPVCELFCDSCNGCDVNRDHTVFVSSDAIPKEQVSQGEFNYFEKKNTNNL